MKSITLKLLLVIILCNFMVNIVKPSDEEVKKETAFKIKTPELALQRALEYTGFDKSKTFIAKPAGDIAILTKLHDSLTPFIGDTINSKSVWLVKFVKIQLQSHDGPLPAGRYPEDFDVILDPETGDLLKINSSFNEFEPDRQYDSPPELKEKDPGGLQSFYGFPKNLPKLSFYDIISLKPSVRVKHVSATYIKQYHPMYGDRDKGYWCIIYRGIVGPNARISVEEYVTDPENGNIVAVKGKRKGSLFDH